MQRPIKLKDRPGGAWQPGGKGVAERRDVWGLQFQRLGEYYGQEWDK